MEPRRDEPLGPCCLGDVAERFVILLPGPARGKVHFQDAGVGGEPERSDGRAGVGPVTTKDQARHLSLHRGAFEDAKERRKPIEVERRHEQMENTVRDLDGERAPQVPGTKLAERQAQTDWTLARHQLDRLVPREGPGLGHPIVVLAIEGEHPTFRRVCRLTRLDARQDVLREVELGGDRCNEPPGFRIRVRPPLVVQQEHFGVAPHRNPVMAMQREHDPARKRLARVLLAKDLHDEPARVALAKQSRRQTPGIAELLGAHRFVVPLGALWVAGNERGLTPHRQNEALPLDRRLYLLRKCTQRSAHRGAPLMLSATRICD